MKKPARRSQWPARRSDNEKRALDPDPEFAALAGIANAARYSGSSKHKINPNLFGLDPFRGTRADETRCDEHAGFAPADMPKAGTYLRQGIRIGLVSQTRRMAWAVAESGWIFEARITNMQAWEFHGYPLLPTDPFAEKVFQRFAAWAALHGSPDDRNAVTNCRAFYGFPDD